MRPTETKKGQPSELPLIAILIFQTNQKAPPPLVTKATPAKVAVGFPSKPPKGLLIPWPFFLVVRITIRAKHLEVMSVFYYHVGPATPAGKMVEMEVIKTHLGGFLRLRIRINGIHKEPRPAKTAASSTVIPASRPFW